MRHGRPVALSSDIRGPGQYNEAMTTDTATETEEKAAFAALLLRERDPFKAALTLFPNNTNRALWIAAHWPKDPEFIALQAAINSKADEMSFLPGKAHFAQQLLDRMEGRRPDGSIIPPSADDYAKIAKIYANVRGFEQKPETAVVNNNVIVQKVIEVPTHGSNEEWEVAVEKQQTELLNVSRSKH